MKIFKYIVVHKREFPAWQKAHKLARTMSHGQIEDILAGKKHVHSNPTRKPRSAQQEVTPCTSV